MDAERRIVLVSASCQISEMQPLLETIGELRTNVEGNAHYAAAILYATKNAGGVP